MRNLVAAVLFLFCTFSLSAQEAAPAAAPARGSVTGRVICSDTAQPARFATVQLLSEKSEPIKFDSKADFAAVFSKILKGNGLSSLTHLDGSFEIYNVMPGTYYVISQLPGYLSPFSQLSGQQVMTGDDEMQKQLAAQAQKIVVEPGHEVHVELRLERGSAIRGQVLYDDGSPAANVLVLLMLKQKEGGWKKVADAISGVNPVHGATDDQGRFRYAGLAPGEYGVTAQLPVTQTITGGGSVAIEAHGTDALQVYSGNVFREREMKGFTLSAGEEYTGADLIFPVMGLYRLSGTVIAARDAHPVNTGRVQLLDPVDKTVLRSGVLLPQGTFSFDYLPAGEYLIRVAGAADVDPNAKPKKLGGGLDFFSALPGVQDSLRPHAHDYGQTDQLVSVHGELAGVSVVVPDLPVNGEGKAEGTH